MTLRYPVTFVQRFASVLERALGSAPTLQLYTGEPPDNPEDMPTGERVPLPKGVRYWRLIDASGRIILQGDDT